MARSRGLSNPDTTVVTFRAGSAVAEAVAMTRHPSVAAKTPEHTRRERTYVSFRGSFPPGRPPLTSAVGREGLSGSVYQRRPTGARCNHERGARAPAEALAGEPEATAALG